MLNQSNFETFLTKNKEIIDFTVNQRCSKCGNCCTRNLPLTQKEINIIKNFVKINKPKMNKNSFNLPTTDKTISMLCPFLIKEDQKDQYYCSIYNI